MSKGCYYLWKISGSKPIPISASQKVDGNFSFLYSRESDVIGAKVPKPQEKGPKLLTKTEFLKQHREKLVAEGNCITLSEEEVLKRTSRPSKPPPSYQGDAEELLQLYQHDAKSEDPRYVTSSSDYGAKKPSMATAVSCH